MKPNVVVPADYMETMIELFDVEEEESIKRIIETCKEIDTDAEDHKTRPKLEHQIDFLCAVIFVGRQLAELYRKEMSDDQSSSS